MLEINRLYNMDCLEGMRMMDDESVDLVVTDPPYGWSFMGKDWDKAIPPVSVWEECLRVLKPGAFAFVMSGTRQDCLSRMIVNLQDAGFETGFTSIYWAYASGFPKAMNIGKAVDKRLGAEREVVGNNIRLGDKKSYPKNIDNALDYQFGEDMGKITLPSTPQAKALDGSYAGFQPKPAVEVIIVCMKPLETKTYVDQALKNGKGITWLDDGRIPYKDEGDSKATERCNTPGSGRFKKSENAFIYGGGKGPQPPNVKMDVSIGRFPANLLVSDDVLNDGRVSKSVSSYRGLKADIRGNNFCRTEGRLLPDSNTIRGIDDSGSFSRYFDLDKWAVEKGVKDTFPFMIVPKASKGEKNAGLDGMPDKTTQRYGKRGQGTLSKQTPQNKIIEKNTHPTCKPVKLMAYLITLGSREGDVVLDPYIGSGTTGVACVKTNRNYTGCENDKEMGYFEIAEKRIAHEMAQYKLELA